MTPKEALEETGRLARKVQQLSKKNKNLRRHLKQLQKAHEHALMSKRELTLGLSEANKTIDFLTTSRTKVLTS
jgi:hypothetical protein